jgi:predicted phosphoribosyltransferase
VIFQNRDEAGRLLAAKLSKYRADPGGLILALPRGGVAVGYAMSVELHLPLDVFVARKIGSPENLEYALGAISETGNIYWNPEAVSEFRLSSGEIHDLVRVQQEEIHRRQRIYRQGRQPPSLHDRAVILVDDGIATGATFFVSIEAVRRQAPRLLIAAIPVGPTDTIRKIKPLVDELVWLATPDPFWSVGGHYAEFSQVSDEEVLRYLHLADAARRERTGPASTSCS